jgi:hypothetical protein
VRDRQQGCTPCRTAKVQCPHSDAHWKKAGLKYDPDQAWAQTQMEKIAETKVIPKTRSAAVAVPHPASSDTDAPAAATVVRPVGRPSRIAKEKATEKLSGKKRAFSAMGECPHLNTFSLQIFILLLFRCRCGTFW